MVRSALRSAYYALVSGDRAAWALPGSCPPASWTPNSVVKLSISRELTHSEHARMLPAGGSICVGNSEAACSLGYMFLSRGLFQESP